MVRRLESHATLAKNANGHEGLLAEKGRCRDRLKPAGQKSRPGIDGNSHPGIYVRLPDGPAAAFGESKTRARLGSRAVNRSRFLR
jgi:hypothetical protein